jgi:hypothetical protein
MTVFERDWFLRVEQEVPELLRALKVGSQPGRYLPCLRGATEVGREMSLAWSCFALKTLHVIRRWELLSREEREGWVEFIQDFQRPGDGAFEDPPEMQYLRRSPGLLASLLRLIGRGPWRPDPHSILLAETKQSIATLAEVGARASRPFRTYPTTPDAVRAWLESQDWSKPWGAGGQSAGLVVFLATQAPALIGSEAAAALLAVCREFFSSIADAETGAYFRGSRPAHGELVNGAMKVLMALDWLDQPIHYPDRLIATVIAHPPKPEGCHLVDAVYVIHRALAGREAESPVRDFCREVFELLRAHCQEGGGFSFYLRKAQTHYYGVHVSRGLDEADLQGTCLLMWGASLIWQIMEPGGARWNVLKP